MHKPPHPPFRILIVDDEESFARMVHLNLEQTAKFVVKTLFKGKETLEAARSFRPHVILLDVVMTDVGGEKVAARLKEDPDLAKIPIVFLTATIDPDKINQLPSDLSVAVLSKPTSLDQLMECLGKVLPLS